MQPRETGTLDGQIDDWTVAAGRVGKEVDLLDVGLERGGPGQFLRQLLLEGRQLHVGLARPERRLVEPLDDEGMLLAAGIEADELWVEVGRESGDGPRHGDVETEHTTQWGTTGQKHADTSLPNRGEG